MRRAGSGIILAVNWLSRVGIEERSAWECTRISVAHDALLNFDAVALLDRSRITPSSVGMLAVSFS